MKGFIFKVVLFSLFIFGVNLLYLILIQKTDWNFQKRIESQTLNDPNFDLLVLGNSLSMDGIDTKYLSENGYPSYNLSIGGASLRSNYLQLEEYLNNYKHKPRIVVLGRGSYLNSFTANDIHPIIDFTRENKTFNFQNLPMLKFRWLFKELLKKAISKNHRNARIEYGQLKFEKVVYDNTSINKENKLPIDGYRKSKLIQEIIDLCNAYNIKLFVIEMPGFKKVRHPKSINCLLLDKENKNGLLVDLNTIEAGEKFDDKKDWIGNSHLNIDGARKFTMELFNYLEMDPSACK